MKSCGFGCGVVGIPLKDLKQKLCLQNGTHNALILTIVKQLLVINIDPNPDEIYTKRKKRIVNVMMSSIPSSSPSVKYPNDGWGNSLERMPSFTRAEMNQHIMNE